jgi:hypothetical protein
MTLPTVLIILAPFILLLILLGFITLNRYITYKERVALAQLGLSLDELGRREAVQRYGNRGVLWGGVITAASGLALLLGLAPLGAGAWLIGGLLPLFVGLGIMLIYFLTMGSPPRNAERHGDADENPAADPDVGSSPEPSSGRQGA